MKNYLSTLSLQIQKCHYTALNSSLNYLSYVFCTGAIKIVFMLIKATHDWAVNVYTAHG